MFINHIEGATLPEVQGAIELAIAQSRFTAQVFQARSSGWGVKIVQVRLRRKKHYCGNHPCGCEGSPHRHAKRNFLEGADWVEFNDLLNNTLDKMNVSADVRSAACILRKGKLRRIAYFEKADFNRIKTWEYDDPNCYLNHCGSQEPHFSDFPYGTPGIYVGYVGEHVTEPGGIGYYAIGHEEYQDEMARLEQQDVLHPPALVLAA